MPVTQIPPSDPLSAPPEQPEQRDLFEAQHWETAYRGFNPDDVPHLLIQLQDDLSRARKREALWLSVILHFLVIILLWNTEKIMGLWTHPVELAMKTDTSNKSATYLELPPDEQKLTRRPDAKISSDKDRIATSKAPQINREDLKKLLQSRRPGPAGASTPQPPAQAQPPQNQAQSQEPPAPQEQQGQGLSQPQPSDQTSQLQTPPRTNRPIPNFNTTTTAGTAIQQALDAAAANRGHSGGGIAGDGGLSRGQHGAKANDAVEILTDTQGYNFWPYLQRIHDVVQNNWFLVMPESVYPPISKKGKVQIDFVILKDGKTMGMTVHTPSGDIALDRAAWGSITNSTPFPPLPKDFPGQILGLRFSYYYNIDASGGDVK